MQQVVRVGLGRWVPEWFVYGALLAHGGKAGARAVVNASPEPFSNVAVSTTEDVVTGGLLFLAYQFPVAAALIAALLLAAAIGLLVMARRILKRLFGRRTNATER